MAKAGAEKPVMNNAGKSTHSSASVPRNNQIPGAVVVVGGLILGNTVGRKYWGEKQKS